MDHDRLRVCLVTGEYPPLQGGVGDYTAHLARHLAAEGVEVAVATSQRTGAGEELGNPTVWRAVEHWNWLAMRRVGRQAARWGADVVHLQYQSAAYQLRAAANFAPLLIRGLGARPSLVVTFHDLKVPYLFPKAGPLRKLSVQLLSALADACVVTNAEDARALRSSRLGRRSPNRVIPIGSNIPTLSSDLDRAGWRLRMGAKPDDLVLAYFGFLNQTKGVDLLLAAVGELLGRGRRVRLVMIGGTAGDSDPTNRAYERKIRKLADVAPLRGNVYWTGFTSESAVSAHLMASDICVLPFREGASFRHGTLVAAIEQGLPIISTFPPCGDESELGRVDGLDPLENGVNALLVPAGDQARLTEAIEQLCASPELLARLRAGTARLVPQFSWPTIARQTIRLYQKVLGK